MKTVREVIADYLWSQDFEQVLGKDGAEKEADSILSALKEAGYAVVPFEMISDKLQEAGAPTPKLNITASQDQGRG